jgi:hypothetical protein
MAVCTENLNHMPEIAAMDLFAVHACLQPALRLFPVLPGKAREHGADEFSAREN